MMWPFKKRISLKDSGIFDGFIDRHTHILPGVDDGVQTPEEALAILRLYEQLGVREVWLTPHIMEDIPNTTTHLRERFAELQTAYTGNVKLYLAAEYMLDNLFEERLEKNDLLILEKNEPQPLGKTKPSFLEKSRRHLLVETSYFSPPMGLNNILLRIKSKGYIPVLAHPERYNYMDTNNYRQLKELNVKFQLNLFSLTGAYGTGIRKRAEWLMKNGFYNLAGSDTHSFAALETALYQKVTEKTIIAYGYHN